MRTSLTPIERFSAFIKGIFLGGALQSLWVGQFFLYPAIALPVCLCSCTQLSKRQRQEVDSSYFIIKRGFLWGTYKENGLGLLGA